MRNRLLAVVLLAGLAGNGAVGSQPASPAGPRIPLCSGLTIVTAVSDMTGDYETIKKIESVTPSAVRLVFSAEHPPGKKLIGGSDAVEKIRSARTVRSEDLTRATQYARFFSTALPETIPGTTALGASKAVLNSLRTTGEAELAVPNEGLLIAVERAGADDIEFETQKIRRVGSGRVSVPVIVNDVRVDLPALHARGEFFGEPAEFFFLDDPDNPLALRYAVARGELGDLLGEMTTLLSGAASEKKDRDSRDVLNVVKISYSCAPASVEAEAVASGRNPVAGSGSGAGGSVAKTGAGHSAAERAPAAGTLERTLAETGRADVYSMYFSFNSDQLREESEPTLKEIAAVLAKHPDWKLSIEGHTDGIASDSFNLDLSRRRAAAVKDALVKRYRVDATRLATAGYGKSRPKDRNDTLEGRARNRRVELVRLP